MKITKSQLRQIIKEEIQKSLNESGIPSDLLQKAQEVYKSQGGVPGADPVDVAIANTIYDLGLKGDAAKEARKILIQKEAEWAKF